MAVDPESLYRQLGALIADMPELDAEPTRATERWVARAFALVQASGDVLDATAIRTATGHLGNYAMRAGAARAISAAVERAFARAELHAPVAAQGAFIPVGAAF